MLLAVPVGRLADRLGRRQVFVTGYALLLVVYAALVLPSGGMGETVVVVIALGTFYAATDGVLMALASSMLPEASRATGLSLIVSATSIGRLFASIAFGAAWTLVGVDTALIIFAGALTFAAVGSALVFNRSRHVPPQQGRRLSRRATVFVVVVLCCIAGAAASVALAVVRAHTSHPPAGVRIHTGSSLAGAQGPQLLFRNAITDKTFGKLAVAPLSDPDHVRAVTDLSCDRVYYAHGSGALPDGDELVREQLRGEDLRCATSTSSKTLKLPGLPSRARISRDGVLGAMTTFVNGDSYNPGNFSTRTSIINLHTGDTVADLEDFRVLRDGKDFKRQNFNFWGVTFAHDDDRIYATLGSGKESYLVQGSIKSRTFHVLTTHLECPSLSPDETRIAFKQSLDSHGSLAYLRARPEDDEALAARRDEIGRRPGRVARQQEDPLLARHRHLGGQRRRQRQAGGLRAQGIVAVGDPRGLSRSRRLERRRATAQDRPRGRRLIILATDAGRRIRLVPSVTWSPA